MISALHNLADYYDFKPTDKRLAKYRDRLSSFDLKTVLQVLNDAPDIYKRFPSVSELVSQVRAVSGPSSMIDCKYCNNVRFTYYKASAKPPMYYNDKEIIYSCVTPCRHCHK